MLQAYCSYGTCPHCCCSLQQGLLQQQHRWEHRRAELPFHASRSPSGAAFPGAAEGPADVQCHREGEGWCPSSTSPPALTCMSIKKTTTPYCKTCQTRPPKWLKEEEMPRKPFSFRWFRKGIECYCLSLAMFFKRRSHSRHIIF